MVNLTIKKIDERVVARLRAQAKKRRMSMNALIKEILAEHAGVDAASAPAKISEIAGTWSDEDLEEFERNTQQFREVDPEVWR